MWGQPCQSETQRTRAPHCFLLSDSLVSSRPRVRTRPGPPPSPSDEGKIRVDFRLILTKGEL